MSYNSEEELKRLLSEQSTTDVASSMVVDEDDEHMEEITSSVNGKPSFIRLNYEEIVASEQELVPDQIQVGWEVKDGKLSVIYRNAAVPVSKNTAYYPYIINKGIKAFHVNCHDQQIRLLIISKIMKDAWNIGIKKHGKPKFAITKDADGHEFNIYVGFREVFNEIVGDELSLYPMIKPWGPCCTPYRLRNVSSNNRSLHILVIDTKSVDGYTTHDGELFLKARISYKKYLSEKAISELVEAGKPTEYFNRIDHAQLRVSGYGENVVKANGYFDIGETNCFIKYFGFNPDDYDGAIEIGNFKTNPLGLKHGDIWEVNSKNIHIINYITGGASSLGVQLVAAPSTAAKNLLVEKGIEFLGGKLKGAFAARAEDVKYVLKQDQEMTMEDAHIMEQQCLSFAIPRDGDWFSPMYKSTYNRLAARLETFYLQSVVKVRVSNYCFYAKSKAGQLLDRIEEAALEKGKKANAFIAPNNVEFLKELNEHKYCSLYRSPLVSRGNIQTGNFLTVKNALLTNEEIKAYGLIISSIDSKDGSKYIVCKSKTTIMMSEAFWKEAFGDFDGDISQICLSNTAFFQHSRTELPEIKKVKEPPKVLTNREFLDYLMDYYVQSIQSAMDIGIIDVTCRQIYIERMEAGNPVKHAESQIMGFKREATIQLKKHKGGKTAAVAEDESIADEIIKEFGVNGKIQRGSSVPMAHRLLLRTAGIPMYDKEGRFIRTNLNVLCERIRMFNSINPNPNDPYSPLWVVMKGSSFNMRESDSEYWRRKLVDLWNRIDEAAGIQFGPKTRSLIRRCADELINGSNNYYGYRAAARTYAKLEDENRRAKAFSGLTKEIKAKINLFVADIVGDNEVKRLALTRALAVYIGTISFGMVNSEKGVYSKPGYCFWYFDKNVLSWIAEQVHPDNPYIIK